MKYLRLPIVLAAAVLAAQLRADPGVLSLKADELRNLELESLPPWPPELVLSGTNEHWQKVLHKGEYVVTIYEAMPALIDVSYPFPYDEFVTVLEGEVTLTATAGDKQTYRVGDSFLVPRGWTGTWDMPYRFREMIVVETRAWEASEE